MLIAQKSWYVVFVSAFFLFCVQRASSKGLGEAKKKSLLPTEVAAALYDLAADDSAKQASPESELKPTEKPGLTIGQRIFIGVLIVGLGVSCGVACKYFKDKDSLRRRLADAERRANDEGWRAQQTEWRVNAAENDLRIVRQAEVEALDRVGAAERDLQQARQNERAAQNRADAAAQQAREADEHAEASERERLMLFFRAIRLQQELDELRANGAGVDDGERNGREALATLGFDPNAAGRPSADEMRMAYRILSLAVHPDKARNEEEKPIRTEMFKRLGDARDVLGIH